MTATLLLVRHATTTWHVERRLQGRTDVPLTPFGEEQARRLRTTFADVALDSVITSDLTRTVETARLMGFSQPTRDPAWAEGDFGDWTGRAIDEVGEQYDLWRLGRFDPPGGEPLSVLAHRVLDAAGRFTSGTHLVVTHGGVIRMLVERLLGVDLAVIAPVECAHVAIVRLGQPARLLAYNLPPGSPLPTAAL